MDPFFLLDKEKIDADESKFEKEVWKAKHLGILALGAGEEVRFPQSGWSAVHKLIHSAISSQQLFTEYRNTMMN